MKPRVFIGSSAEGLPIANAVHSSLQRVGECIPWHKGVVGPSTSTLGSLMEEARKTDFAIFVFSPDDVTEMRGNLLQVARDNVVFELGLFSGKLAPERCFFPVPQEERMHLPTDLAGITPGEYESRRSDKNWKAAVGPFCSDVEVAIKKLGRIEAPVPIKLHELAVKFECADWVEPLPRKVERKRTIVAEMIEALKRQLVDKARLLLHDRVGFKVLLGAAIQAVPIDDDDELLLSIAPASVPRGVAQRAMVEALDKLAKARLIPSKLRAQVKAWLDGLHDVDSALVG